MDLCSLARLMFYATLCVLSEYKDTKSISRYCRSQGSGLYEIALLAGGEIKHCVEYSLDFTKFQTCHTRLEQVSFIALSSSIIYTSIRRYSGKSIYTTRQTVL